MDGVNLDTSVLVDYLRVRLDDELTLTRLSESITSPDKTRTLLQADDRTRVIGHTVNAEFENLCERHARIYDDLLSWSVDNPATSLLEYDITQRDVSASDNDLSFVRFEIQVRWEADERETQLSHFRRLKQRVTEIQTEIHGLLDETYSPVTDETLANTLASLELGHDSAVVVDAVHIAMQDGIDRLVSTDSDLTDNQSEINDSIQQADHSLSLEIVEPGDM